MASRLRRGESRDDSCDTRLHRARKKQDVIRLLSQSPPIDVNGCDERGDTALHCYINRQSEEGYSLLLCLLTNCDVNRIQIDTPGPLFNSPLHLAAQVGNLDATKALIAFGANIDALNINWQTPLDIACNDDIRVLLISVGSDSGDIVRERLDNYKQLPPAPVISLEESGIDWRGLSQSNDATSLSSSLLPAVMNNYTAWLEWKQKQGALQEQKRRRTFVPPVFKARDGERVLCLDGGGMRGLILVEVLNYITQTTRRRIGDLFEWVVATSTGGVIALGLVYANLSTQEVRQLYFEMKEKVFGKARFGYGCDTEAQEALLKRVFGESKMVELENGPKVLISAVDKTTDKLELYWFNNFLKNDTTLYGRPLWEVARATSAAPGFFKPLKQYINGELIREYVDGGLRANNPSDSGLSVIQEYLRGDDETSTRRRKVSLVVSVGCGDFPGQKLGDVDIDKYLFLEKNFPWLSKVVGDIKNLMRLFIRAIDNSEAETNTRVRCDELRVAFYRFNPKFDKEIALNETDDKKLCDMITLTRAHIISRQTHMDEIIQSFCPENQ